jgi:hypothetical protein
MFQSLPALPTRFKNGSRTARPTDGTAGERELEVSPRLTGDPGVPESDGRWNGILRNSALVPVGFIHAQEILDDSKRKD